jgi:tetratricopeptide (TPR) repeat protein
MFELKPLSQEAVGRALEKAERYRLLNEPAEAESICEDVLRIAPDNQQAMVTLLLALTDQFEGQGRAEAASRARELVARLEDEYARAYYSGIVCERRAKAQFKQGGPGSGSVAYEAFRQAMSWYEKAEAVRPPGNDDALLRWNACARILERSASLVPVSRDTFEQPLE